MLTLRFSLIATLAVTFLLFAACGGDDDDLPDAGGDTANTPQQTDGSDGTGDDGDDGDDGNEGDNRDDNGDDGSDVDMCGLLTSDEVANAVGNPVEEGRVDFGQSCVWDSDPNETNVSVYLNVFGVDDIQQVCVDALESDDLYTELDGFDAPAYSSYNGVAGGQSDVVVCLEQGQFQLIVTGGLDDEPDEDEMRATAEELALLALDRL